MIELALRRERADSPLAAPGFLWDVPQKPVSVSLTFEMIDRVEREVVEGFRSLTSRGSEIGGLLLGKMWPGAPACVFVEDFETVECDYSRGPLYRLSEVDLGRLERAIEKRTAGGLEVVGFFRSHTRKGLSLDAEDLAFLDSHLGNPSQIALLVRPFATKASVAGIFIREDGVIHGDASYLEFPFRTSQLAAAKKDAAAPARAQIVPIASRREISLAPITPVEEQPVAVVPEPEPAPPIAIPEPAPQPQAVVEIPAPDPPPAVPAVAPAEPKRRRLAFIAGLAAAFVISIVMLLSLSRQSHSVNSPVPQPVSDADSLNLRAGHNGTDLLLTWNRDAAAIQNAARATLTVADGDRQESYDMDLGQLRTGSIIYVPLTSDVSFKLDVTGRDQRIATATMRMLRSKPSPMPAVTAGVSVAATAHEALGENAASVGVPDKPSEPPSLAGSPVKPFDAGSLAARLRPVRTADQPDLPNISGAAPVTPRVNQNASVPFGSVPAAVPPPPPAAAAVANNSSPATNVGGRIQQAELLSRREPEYPALARQMGTKGTVELVATIGTDGHVKEVKVIHGQPVLARAATEAVMQWIYRPTLLNGVPVPNETRITLNFMGR